MVLFFTEHSETVRRWVKDPKVSDELGGDPETHSTLEVSILITVDRHDGPTSVLVAFPELL